MSGLSMLMDEIKNSGVASKSLSVKRNEYIITPGRIEQYLYIVESGALRVFYVSESGEQNIRFGYKNSILTSLASFISGAPSEYYIQAIRQTSLKLIHKKDFQAFVRSTPGRFAAYQSLLETFVLQQMEREIDLLTESPEERYRRVLKRSPHLFQEIPSKYIASYLRMSPETLSRLKNLTAKSAKI